MQIPKLANYNNDAFFLIAGPCAIEDKDMAFEIAANLKAICEELGIPLIFKGSYKKANRSRLDSFTGIGDEKALRILKEVGDHFQLPVITDIHEAADAAIAAAYVDVLQIPAFLCRQTDLLVAAAKTGKGVNVKKGQFLAPWDMANVVKKIEESGNKNILITERGASFGYNTLVSDMRALPIMSKFGFPIVFDATHSVQQPGGMGEKSGGQREFVPYLARAAIAVGVGAIFMETNEDPDNAPSDGPNMVPIKEVKSLLKKLTEIDKLVK